MKHIFYLMGKSASGKDAVYKCLLQDPKLNLKPFLTYTTRPIRDGEREGEAYYFVDEEELKELLADGKVIELREYPSAYGPWRYFTVDDGQTDGEEDLAAIGTPQSFKALRDHYGPECVIPIYIETEPGLRLERALHRERKQEVPKYDEMCRRFLADEHDFREEVLEQYGITEDCRIRNEGTKEELFESVTAYIRRKQSEETG